MSLIQSILNQNVRAVAHHLQRPTELNFIDDYGFTPLIEAAIVNNVEIVTMLLQHGADPNHEDEKGSTALHWATENNNHHIAKILLSSGANPNIYNVNSQSPLVIPLLRKQAKMKQLLYHYKANLSFAQDFINTKLLGVPRASVYTPWVVSSLLNNRVSISTISLYIASALPSSFLYLLKSILSNVPK